MRRIDKLRKEARESATFRGHEMTKRWYLPCNEPARQVLRCTRCGKQVEIIMNPAPNEIDIAGEAVALNCEPPKPKEETNKYQTAIQEMTQDIENIGKKTYLGTAIASHLRGMFRELSREDSENEVNLFFLKVQR